MVLEKGIVFRVLISVVRTEVRMLKSFALLGLAFRFPEVMGTSIV